MPHGVLVVHLCSHAEGVSGIQGLYSLPKQKSGIVIWSHKDYSEHISLVQREIYFRFMLGVTVQQFS